MTKSQKRDLYKIIIAAVLLAAGAVAEHMTAGGMTAAEHTAAGVTAAVALYLASYALVGYEVVISAVKGIGRGQLLDENFLMTVASIGALVLGEYTEGVAVMLLFCVGELFEDYAVNKSRRSIGELMDIRPDYANLYDAETRTDSEVDPYDVRIGDLILIKPGEKVPLDGVVVNGSSSLQTAALTGEAMPVDVTEGDEILSGCINMTGVLTVRVTKEFDESTASKILELVENAASSKAQTERFITKFARVYTPLVVGIAVLLAVLPPLILQQSFSVWVYRAMVFLVISCPCALVISVPLSFFGGIGGASKAGILVKGSNYLEALARVDTVVFDKTGTLTTGSFKVSQIRAVGTVPEAMAEELLELCAYAESFSPHPIAQSIVEAYGKEIRKERVESVDDEAGYGITARIRDERGELHTVQVGNVKLMNKLGAEIGEAAAAHAEQAQAIGTIVYAAVDGAYRGLISITDEIKEDAGKTVEGLRKKGVGIIAMLTGDRKETAESIGKRLGITSVFSELLPAEKLLKVEELLNGRPSGSKGTLVYVGDGINDAPVLARADIGVAMGALGSDAAIDAADAVIMTDEPSKLLELIEIAKKTVGISKQNIVFALAVKALILVLGATGYANMWAAVFADVGVAMIAILNSMRTLRN